ncbi:MAG TPA: hypothetical protein VKV77_04385 [Methylovirgula sp.]|nr:hypothetical protein [Methylovirgula sp.]
MTQQSKKLALALAGVLGLGVAGVTMAQPANAIDVAVGAPGYYYGYDYNPAWPVGAAVGTAAGIVGGTVGALTGYPYGYAYAPYGYYAYGYSPYAPAYDYDEW